MLKLPLDRLDKTKNNEEFEEVLRDH